MSELRYRSFVDVNDLAVGECTIHRAGNSEGARWWNLWFRVLRDSDGQPDDFVVPINPGGSFIEAGPGGRTWGFVRVAAVEWQVSPSINVIDTRALHPGAHDAPSLWHQTPKIMDVPDGESWIGGPP